MKPNTELDLREKIFTEENRLLQMRQRIDSPTEDYYIIVDHYNSGDGYINWTKGSVYKTKGDVFIAEVKRNYGDFWSAFITHPVNGKDYLFCGEDYQGMSRVDLSSGVILTDLPDAAKKGWGWCPVEASISPDGSVLQVEGCYWACPFEIRLYDSSDPEVFPMPLLRTLDVGCATFVGWKDRDVLIADTEVTGVMIDDVFFLSPDCDLPPEVLEEHGWGVLHEGQWGLLEEEGAEIYKNVRLSLRLSYYIDKSRKEHAFPEDHLE